MPGEGARGEHAWWMDIQLADHGDSVFSNCNIGHVD